MNIPHPGYTISSSSCKKAFSQSIVLSRKQKKIPQETCSNQQSAAPNQTEILPPQTTGPWKNTNDPTPKENFHLAPTNPRTKKQRRKPIKGKNQMHIFVCALTIWRNTIKWNLIVIIDTKDVKMIWPQNYKILNIILKSK